MPDIDDVIETVDKVATVLSQMLSFFMIMLLVSDMLGINVFQLTFQLIRKPWVIPWEIIEQYLWLWRTLLYVLLGIMLFDQAYNMLHQHRYGRPPSPNYARYMSMTIFILSFWLTLVLRYSSLMLITAMSAISFAYTVFVKREE